MHRFNAYLHAVCICGVGFCFGFHLHSLILFSTQRRKWFDVYDFVWFVNTYCMHWFEYCIEEKEIQMANAHCRCCCCCCRHHRHNIVIVSSRNNRFLLKNQHKSVTCQPIIMFSCKNISILLSHYLTRATLWLLLITLMNVNEHGLKWYFIVNDLCGIDLGNFCTWLTDSRWFGCRYS